MHSYTLVHACTHLCEHAHKVQEKNELYYEWQDPSSSLHSDNWLTEQQVVNHWTYYWSCSLPRDQCQNSSLRLSFNSQYSIPRRFMLLQNSQFMYIIIVVLTSIEIHQTASPDTISCIAFNVFSIRFTKRKQEIHKPLAACLIKRTLYLKQWYINT